jgi:hypothetical protein
MFVLVREWLCTFTILDDTELRIGELMSTKAYRLCMQVLETLARERGAKDGRSNPAAVWPRRRTLCKSRYPSHDQKAIKPHKFELRGAAAGAGVQGSEVMVHCHCHGNVRLIE